MARKPSNMGRISPSLNLTPTQINSLKEFGLLLCETQTPFEAKSTFDAEAKPTLPKKEEKKPQSDNPRRPINVTSFFDKRLIECFDTTITSELEVGDKIFLHGEGNIAKSIYVYLGRDAETDSFILRKLSEEGDCFTIPQFICNSLHIEFHPRNVLASSKLKWKLYIPDFISSQEINPNDLSTYPTMEGKISCIGVKLEGIKNQDADTFILPDGKIIKKINFWDSFYVKVKKQLGQYNQNNINRKIPYVKVTSVVGNYQVEESVRKSNSVFNTSTDEDGNVWILLDLRTFNLTPNELRGCSVNDLFEFVFPKGNVSKQNELDEKVRQFYSELTQFRPSLEERIVPRLGELMKPSDLGGLFKPSTSWTEVDADDVTTSMMKSGKLVRTLDGSTYEVYRNGRWVVTDARPN